MRPIWILAKNTFKEVIRDRILYALLLFAVMLIGLSLALGQLSFAEQERISANFGLSAIHLVAIALAIFIGSNLVYKEIEKKTILTILVRPISRLQFILGKALGLSMLIAAMTAALAAILMLVFYGLNMKIDERFAIVLAGLFAEALILLGFTLVFSMFTKPLLVVCFSVGIFLIGHWQGSLQFFAKKAEGGVLPAVAWVVNHALPDLDRVNWKDLVLYNQPIDMPGKLMALGYALAWFVFCVCISAMLFKRKDVG
ncbi:MAG: ABC transporter permease [Bdellovibrionales bacterium]|nr:ABC transporter permease [Bdellovibrionales bacterium]